jgi:hypothetical protein
VRGEGDAVRAQRREIDRSVRRELGSVDDYARTVPPRHRAQLLDGPLARR